MLKVRRAAAEAVRSAFLPAEAAQDLAAREAARCLSVALEARAEANLGLGIGLNAISLLSKGVAHAVEARQSMIEAHRALALIPAEIGLTRAWGEEGDCPPIEQPALAGIATPSLRVVA
ncbi:hypothetical protein LZK98_17700 [Sphingomonas cannabina]|uniref:hypothetical protein n=1 Tax=Sphingomonas cannabina TaxID=2899123 RepID=UPI001F19EBB1|nr:hypothetical protein [Sphingomonas cannabina]UIJ44863.1 hypothetical protein LZK98_17700 [Sphingomonas cannabina]